MQMSNKAICQKCEISRWTCGQPTRIITSYVNLFNVGLCKTTRYIVCLLLIFCSSPLYFNLNVDIEVSALPKTALKISLLLSMWISNKEMSHEMPRWTCGGPTKIKDTMCSVLAHAKQWTTLCSYSSSAAHPLYISIGVSTSRSPRCQKLLGRFLLILAIVNIK